ncbi:AEC family transporter [Rhizobium sp. C4]|uniref:AEC family transporter n=1 Tax=Rhizobium sp. C4 TaxID=1349800 RepID=UPI001E48C837|nr:AEC family transporter [Rhizobium sp. C4]MCD2171789.1 AEC family transporter [Rhizobium sp. C4]
MLAIFSITLPIFVLIGTGVIAGRFLGLERGDLRGLSNFVWYFALPGLILRAFVLHPISDFLHLNYLLLYMTASLLTFGISLSVARFARGKTLTESALMALGSSSSNSGFVGFPVASLVVGPLAPIGLALNMIVENLIILPAGMVLAEDGQRGGAGALTALRASLISLIRNPLIISLFIGAAISASGLDFKDLSLFHAIDMLANASGAVALFIVGATLASTKATGSLLPDAAQVSIGKLVLHPLSALAVAFLMPGLEPEMRKMAIIFASSPMLTVYPIIGQRFGYQDMSSAALLMATTASFFTISIMLALV